MKSKTKNKKKTEKINFAKELFAVVKFVEPRDDTKSFECIPDNWLLEEDEEERRRCYWPPKSKKSFTLRAMNRDIPDEDWYIYTCEVVSEGHGKSQNICAFPVFGLIRFLYCSFIQYRSCYCKRQDCSKV